MIEQLFGSKTRVKLLQLFYANPNRSFYVREITRKIDEQINSVRRELANLLSIGIIKSETADDNNRLYYEVNQDYDYYKPLSTIFGGKKGSPAKVEKVKIDDKSDVHSVGNVELVLYTGQFTRDESAGVDVLIVGDVNETKTKKFIAELEEKEGKELRYAIMPRKEFEYRQQVKDRFINGVLGAKSQVVVDKHKLLEK